MKLDILPNLLHSPMNLQSAGETFSGFVKAFGFGIFGNVVAADGGEDTAVLAAASTN